MTERALVVYIGQPVLRNFQIGLEHKTWGFKRNGQGYDRLQPGDWIIFGVTATGTPRVQPDEWATFILTEVVVGRLTSGMFKDETPLWPDRDERYPYRFTFENLDRITHVPLVPGELGPSVIDGLRRAGSKGVVVEADGDMVDRLRSAPFAEARSAENVWLEIQDKCRQHMASETPILTLEREVPNQIVAVEENKIERLSEEARVEDEASSVPKHEIERLWNQLVQDGEVLTSEAHVLRFTQALVGRLIEGVGFDQDRHCLYFTDRARSMRQWVPESTTPEPEEEVVSASPENEHEKETAVAAGSFDDLTLELVRQHLDIRQLRLGPEVVASAVAALRAGKNLILTGPPGTGKTELAFALGDAATAIGLCTDVLPTTATADWTSIETIGGYRLDKDRGLQFSPGCVLQAIQRKQWLIIDEFNRADIDKAVGQLFTALSGQAVTLPYVESRRGVDQAPSIVPAGAVPPANTHPYLIDPRWRIVDRLTR